MYISNILTNICIFTLTRKFLFIVRFFSFSSIFLLLKIAKSESANYFFCSFCLLWAIYYIFGVVLYVAYKKNMC